MELRSFTYPSDVPNGRDVLECAAQVEADLTVITFLDAFGRREYGDLLKQFSGLLTGIRFLGTGTTQTTPLKRLFSGRSRKAYRLNQDLRQPPEALRHIFVLDDSIARQIDRREGLSVSVLPDPWHCGELMSERGIARARLGIPSDREVFLHFGSSDTRKGIEDVIEVWRHHRLPSNALLIRAGRTRNHLSAQLLELVEAGRAIHIDRYLSDEELDDCLCATDWVLLPYRDHHGSSGALAGAAAARRPVICSDEGIVGQRVKRGLMGLTYESKSVEGLLSVICRACECPVDPFVEGLRQYSEEHSIGKFIERFCSALQSHGL